MVKKTNNTWFGKLKRTCKSVLPVDKNRTGKCIHCGACCRLPVKCPFLKFKPDGKSYCSIHPIRILICRTYPRTESEWLTKKTCGFKFK